MWTYRGSPVSFDLIPTHAIGFIYIITHIQSNKKYLGKKLLTKAATKVFKGKKIKIRKPSDWESYYSSSPFLLDLIEKEGVFNFTREIIFFAKGKGELNYAEESFQYRLGVLESDDWFNSNIRSRIFRRSVLNYNLSDLNAAFHSISSS
jgi:hypothetical protein